MNSNKGTLLLAIARAAISESFGIETKLDEGPRCLQTEAACFITLKLNGHLRGCIGSLHAHRPLLEDIRENSRAAAFRDPRFPPLSVEELANLEIEISLLSDAVAMEFTDEASALAQLRPGIDGIIFSYKHYRSTFLPQVWEQLPNTGEFVAHLKQKAGLPRDFWSPEVKLQRYTVTKYREQGVDNRPPTMP